MKTDSEIPTFEMAYSILKKTNSKYLITRFTHSEVDYDIIINGGGIIGTSMALALSKNPQLSQKRILLLENRKQSDRKSSHKTEYSSRVSALSIQSYEFLKSINVWDHIATERYKSIRKCHVLDGLTKKIVTFEQGTHHPEAIAYIVENPLIFHAVEKELTNLKNVNNLTISYDSRIESIQNTKVNTVELMLQDHKRLTCHLLIGADGFNSRVRELLQLKYYNLKYDERILLANIQINDPMEAEDTIWLKFNQDNSIALYPLSKTELSITWCGSTESIQKLQSQTDAQFVDHINETFWEEQHSLKLPPKCVQIVENSRLSFPVTVGYAPEYIKDSVALVGSAAHQPHQFGGKGLNLGFVEVRLLTELIAEVVYRGGSTVADQSMLRNYQRVSHTYNVPKVALFILVYKLYSSNNWAAVFGRNVCSKYVQTKDILKRAVLKFTK